MLAAVKGHADVTIFADLYYILNVCSSIHMFALLADAAAGFCTGQC